MRRLLVVSAALLAVSCAGGSRGPAVALPAPSGSAPAAIPGMEHHPGESLAALDVDRDGKPDVWKYARLDAAGKELLVRKEKDLNGDGRVDTWEAYAADGAMTRLVYDLDFDGNPDVNLFFEAEQLVRKEYALGLDGVSRSWSFYEGSKLVRKERDSNGDGKVDYWEYWEGGEIDRIGVDEDGDGRVDRWEGRRTAQDGSREAAQK
jgi:hypothetical protein